MKKYLVLLITMMVILTAPLAAEAAETDRVCLDTDVYYDTAEKMFVYIVKDAGNVEILSSVADGMVTNNPVSIKYNNSLSVVVFKDGVQLDTNDYSEITETGTYVVQLTGSGISFNVMSFTIVGELGSFSKYKMPRGFSITGMYLDGEEVETNGGEAEFNSEGFYLVDYMNLTTGETYSLKLTIDKTPPTLALGGVVNGIAKQKVSLEDKEEGAVLYIEQDGVPIEPVSALDETGSYYVRITDTAGNYSDYAFKIVVGMNGTTILFIVVFLILLAALGVYLFLERKKMRVR